MTDIGIFVKVSFGGRNARKEQWIYNCGFAADFKNGNK